MVTRRNFLKGIAAFLASYSVGTRIALPETNEELQVVSGKYKAKFPPSDWWVADIKMNFGTPTNQGRLANLYLAPEGVSDEKDCQFLGCVVDDEDSLARGKRFKFLPLYESFRIIAVGAPMEQISVDVQSSENRFRSCG